MAKLPASPGVPVDFLAGIFSRTTNSYKHLFFQAIVRLCERDKYQTRIFHLNDICVEMAALAWYPIKYFHLSFGGQDQTKSVLEKLELPNAQGRTGRSPNQSLIREKLRDQAEGIDLFSSLGRYVHFRLLSPFFPEELSRVTSDAERNAQIFRLASKSFRRRKPLYKINGMSWRHATSITIHPAWLEYLTRNAAIVKGWSERLWIDYLQRRNPSTPAISEKLEAPSRRQVKPSHKKFWKSFIEAKSCRCIYSDALLEPENFALDHFVPWSYICHDQNWNLIPVAPKANSQKSDSLPDDSVYLERFSDIHHEAIMYLLSRFPLKSARNLIEEYESGLKLDTGTTLDRDQVLEAYDMTVSPLISLAKRSGFKAGWIYS